MAAASLNILHIDTEKYWRGGQQQVFYLHNGLIQRGINSILVCNKSSELKIKCEEQNLPFFEIKIFGEIDIIAALRIARICRINRIKIVHAHSAHALSIGIFVKLFYQQVRLIGVRRVDFSIRKNFLSRIKYNNKFVDRIICVSDFIKNVLIKDGLKEEKLITIRSGVDITKFNNFVSPDEFRKSLGVRKYDFLIGTVAAFVGHKDYPNLIKAFSIVNEKFNGKVKLCMVGDGPLKNEIIELAGKLKIEDTIIMPGFRSDIGNFLNSFDLFVLASKKEGLGTSIIDALSVGLPVLATDTGGIPELINDGFNGELVDPRNPKKFAEKIIGLIKDDERRKRYRINAKENVQKFSIENTINKNICEYEELLSQ